MALVPIKPSQVPLAYTLSSDLDLDNDVLLAGSNANSGQVVQFSPAILLDALVPAAGQRYWNVDPGVGFGDQYNYTADATLTAGQDGAVITNSGASQAITLTLPAAVAGMEFSILRVANYDITLDPSGSQTIADGGAGVTLIMEAAGLIGLSCIADSAWVVTSDTTLWNFGS